MLQTNRTLRPRRPAARGGFTLIEMLVVIAIIVILAALSMAAIQRVRITQQVERSSNLVSKLQTGLDNQAMAVRNKVTKERRERSPEFSALSGFCGDDDRAYALLLYCRMRQYFPQTAAEVSASSFAVGGAVFVRPRAFASLAGISGPPDQVAAAALYAALSNQELGGLGFTSDEATTGAVNRQFVIGNGNFPVYVDEFGSPVAFRRFGTNAELQNHPYTNVKSGSLDPYDPQGLLAGWPNKGAAAVVFTNSGVAGDAVNFDGTNRFPVVYSAGKNMTYENLDGDDILGYRLRQLGAKGAKP